MTTRSNTIVRPGGLLRWALCLAALVSLLPLRAADDAPARKVAGELAARFRAMKAYTVTFAVEGDDFAAEGSYAVEGDRYYMRVGDAEAYSDGVSKWEVDPSKREVVVDVVDTQSRSLLGNRRGRSISWTTPSAANCCPPKARCAVCGSRRSTRGRR